MRCFLQQKAIIYSLIVILFGSFAVPTVAMVLQTQTRVLLCTSQGYQWVTVTEDQGSSLGASESKHCLFCLSPLEDEELYFVKVSSNLSDLFTRLEFQSSATERGFLLIFNALARAPPFFI